MSLTPQELDLSISSHWKKRKILIEDMITKYMREHTISKISMITYGLAKEYPQKIEYFYKDNLICTIEKKYKYYYFISWWRIST